MKKILLILFLFNFILYGQESRTTSLEVQKQLQQTFISEVLEVEKIPNNPFIAFSIRLNGNAISKAIDGVYYKNIKDNWQLFPIDENNFEEDNWHALTYLDLAIERTQLKIIFKKPAIIDYINFNFYYPYKTEFLKQEARKKNTNFDKTETKSLASCNCASPTVITRSAWCPDNNCLPNSNLTSTDVKFLIVHHTAGANSSSDWAAVVRSIWNYHVNTNEWSDIGYNFLLDKDGNVYAGREDDTMGAHFSGKNSGTSGISLMGNYNSVIPTTAMIDSLKNLLAWKSCLKNIDPTATEYHASSGLNLKTISGHRDGPKATDCPGHKVYDLLPSIRTEVKQLVDNCVVLAVDDELFGKFKIYPNPFSNKIKIESSLNEGELVAIKCYDFTGRLVFETDSYVKQAATELDLSIFSSGIYWLQLKLNNKIAHFKLIKS